jgi:hypothetical protein
MPRYLILTLFLLPDLPRGHGSRSRSPLVAKNIPPTNFSALIHKHSPGIDAFSRPGSGQDVRSMVPSPGQSAVALSYQGDIRRQPTKCHGRVATGGIWSDSLRRVPPPGGTYHAQLAAKFSDHYFHIFVFSFKVVMFVGHPSYRSRQPIPTTRTAGPFQSC